MRAAAPPSALEQGRVAYARRAWQEAFDRLAALESSAPLGAEDAERLGVAAYMLGRDDNAATFLERAHHRHLDGGAMLRGIRAAFWTGMTLFARGEVGPASGWLARAQRLLDAEPRDSAERGYMLLPASFTQEAAGDWRAAAATAGEAAAIAQRFGDDGLFALAAQQQGRVLVVHGAMDEGLRLLDEAMVAATSGAESPMVTGIVYCGVILACVHAYEVRRAREWTEVLSRWCSEQPELVAFTGRCLVHRAEIMQLRGDWRRALDEAERAGERLAQGFNRPATAQAFYRQGELHRLRGAVAAAESAYAAARRNGLEPQPGESLLRLAQERGEQAAASIRRALAEATEPATRARLLPAAVEILVATGDLVAAEEACAELEAVADVYGSAFLAAAAAHARGHVHLARGDPLAALGVLRRAAELWQELDAPYEAACTQVLLGLSCRALGDHDTGTSDLAAARESFAGLGAEPDVARVDRLLGRGRVDEHGLTQRELEVLRLVAAGRSNREIAAALVLSEHTVARHLQNMFRKLGVSSRTAAGAFAHEHGLV